MEFVAQSFSEEELIQGALAKNEKAWAILLEHYGGKIYGICLRFMANEKEAEDVSQEVWLLISEKLSSFEQNSKLGTWVYRIAVNKCLDHLRSKKRSKSESFDALQPQFTEEGMYSKQFIDWTDRPAVKAERTILREEITRAIDSLPEEYREVLVLRDVEGFSGKETAEMLTLEPATMKTRLHRARMAVRETIEKKFGKKPWYAFLRMLSVMYV
jgi:RNA polymerase sigma-70 factor (ECF subfamily)